MMYDTIFTAWDQFDDAFEAYCEETLQPFRYSGINVCAYMQEKKLDQCGFKKQSKEESLDLRQIVWQILPKIFVFTHGWDKRNRGMRSMLEIYSTKRTDI